jgi:hypothetical protein
MEFLASAAAREGVPPIILRAHFLVLNGDRGANPGHCYRCAAAALYTRPPFITASTCNEYSR